MKRKIRILEILHSFLLISMLYDLIIQVMEPGNPFVVYQNLLLLPAVAALSVSCTSGKIFLAIFSGFRSGDSGSILSGNVWNLDGNMRRTGSIFLLLCKSKEGGLLAGGAGLSLADRISAFVF